MNMQPYKVFRQFTGERAYQVGEIIDVAGWPPRRAQLLTDQRYIAPVMAAPSDAPPAPSQRKGAVHHGDH